MVAGTWHIELLGRCRVKRDGECIDRFRTRKTGALLAYLALYCPRRTVTREELAAVFWADSEPVQADHSLRQSLSWLRSRLEPVNTPAGAVLSAPPRTGLVTLKPGAFSCDAIEFETLLKESDRPNLSPEERKALLRRALALYRGDLLPGVYDDWAQTERERLIAIRDRAEQELTNYAANAKDLSLSAAPDSEERVTNLPNPVNRFWGREEELASLEARLCTGYDRLITVTAPGGFGKTRLAIEVARKVSPAFLGGVFWVSLADQPDSVRLSDVLKAALNMPPVVGKSDGLSRIATVLHRRAGRVLLVVDNAETLSYNGEYGVAMQIARLLDAAPNVSCVVTSRSPLEIAGESEFALAPLPVDAKVPVSPSICLLVDRAQSVRQDFMLTEQNIGHLRALCERLGGIPLALELAAARLRTVSPQILLAEIADPIYLWSNLEDERCGRPERHRRLRVALESSFSALTPQAQRSVAALTLFQSGWTANAADSVLGAGARASLEEIAALAWSVPVGEDRWRLPVPLKEFAVECLVPESRDILLSRHARFFAELARDAFAQRHTAAQIGYLDNLSAERENINLALTTLTQSAPGDALRFAADLAWFWRRRGEWETARCQLNDLLNDSRTGTTDPNTRIEALIGVADLCWSLGRRNEAETAFREARFRAISGPVSPNVGMRAAERLGRFWVDNGRWQAGEPLLAEAHRWYDKVGDRRGAGKCLAGIAFAAHYAEDYSLARRLLHDALREVTDAGDKLEQMSLIHQSGWCGASEESDVERISRCERLLALANETADTLTRATAFLELGEAYRLSGDLQTSQSRLREGITIARSVGAILEESLLRNQEGVTLRLLGRLTDAESAHRDALFLGGQVGQNEFGPRVRIILADFAVLLHEQKQLTAAVRIHGAITAWSERNNMPITPYAQGLYSTEQAELRRVLGEDRFQSAWKSGTETQTVSELL